MRGLNPYKVGIIFVYIPENEREVNMSRLDPVQAGFLTQEGVGWDGVGTLRYVNFRVRREGTVGVHNAREVPRPNR